jgi:hypothetical protein
MTGGMAQAIEYLPSKLKALTKKKKGISNISHFVLEFYL